jgi:uncharacterized protein (DUF58 family)
MKQKAPESRSWTTHALATVATGFIVYWLGLAFRNSHLIVASAVLLTFVALAVAFSSMPSDELSVDRRILPERTTEENIVTLKTTVQNRTQNRMFAYLIETLPKNVEVVEGSQTQLILLEPSSHYEIQNALRPTFRGHFILFPAFVELTDDFGLRVRRTNLGKAVYLSVLPAVEDLSSFPLETKTSQPEIGAFRSGSVGVGTEFFGIRNYLPGDEYRHINWKASARHLSLLSNEYEREHVTNIYLLVDLTSENLGHLKWTTRTASSLATYLLKTRNRLGLIVVGESISHVRIEGGRRQLLRVIDKLITAEPGGTGELSKYLQHTIDQLAPCEIIIITALASENFVKTLTRLYQKPEQCSLVTLTETQERPTKDLVLEVARLIRVLKHRAIVTRIRNSGFRIIELPAGQPLTMALPNLRERPVRR